MIKNMGGGNGADIYLPSAALRVQLFDLVRNPTVMQHYQSQRAESSLYTQILRHFSETVSNSDVIT